MQIISIVRFRCIFNWSLWFQHEREKMLLLSKQHKDKSEAIKGGGMASFVGNSCWALQHRLNYTHLIKTYKIYSITVRNSNNIIYTFFSLSEIFFSLFFFSFSSRFSSIEFGRIANDTNRDRDWVKEHIF